MKRAVLIYHSERFYVKSYGNGLGYAVHDIIDNKSMFVQSDDATEFREKLEAFENRFPAAPYDDFYAEQLAIRE